MLGCGLYAGGPELGAGGSADAGEGGASTDAPPASCTAEGGACVASLPSGWTPLLSVPTAAACPGNFGQRDVVGAPMAPPSACACGCMITTQPSCAKGGVIGIKYGTSGCGLDWGVWPNGGACTVSGFTNVAAMLAVPLPTLTDGVCQSQPVADPSKITRAAARTCAAPSACAEDVCEGHVPAGATACIAHDGDVPCPSGPFSARLGVFGDDLVLACSACGSCTVAAQCGAATLRYYGDASCTSQTASVPMNGTCSPTNASGFQIAYAYDAPVIGVSCAASGASSPSVSLISPRTLCCRP